MKFATLKAPNKRDGILCLVSKNLKQAIYTTPIAQTLQEALDNWATLEAPLKTLAETLEKGESERIFPFEPKNCASPLPRAYQWADGSVYLNHVELVRKSRGVEMPADFLTNPLMYQGGSDGFLGPYEPIPAENCDYGLDFEAEVAVITDDVPMGISSEKAKAHIKLILLVNDISLRQLALKELTKGFGFYQAKPASSFSPIALTPDELGDAWDGAKLHLPLLSYLNGKTFGAPNAGVDMVFSFADLIAHAAKTRTLAAGTIIGSGTVSNKDKSKGSSCLIEKRTIEILEQGEAKTPFLKKGDTVRIEMCSAKGDNLFGSIEQTVGTSA